MTERKTKIVATIGPASSPPEMLRKLIMNGVDVARINFSHGDHDFYAAVVRDIRAIDRELGTHTAILADLQGPKLRVGDMANGAIELKEGDELVITTEPVKGRPGLVSTTYTLFPKDVKKGELVLLDDGKLRLEVTGTDGEKKVTTRVLNGGPLSANKGLNLPNTKVSLPSLTQKDLNDLDYALELDVDWIGLSFVRSEADLQDLKQRIYAKGKRTRVVAKIEKPEALERIDAIIKECDALMVARGDLGVEIPAERVPLIQKDIILRCLHHHRPVIVATQMMESMITSVTPTRAEVNDVANAVLDHADAVMLSAETSVGKYPLETVRMMDRILTEMERSDEMFDVPTHRAQASNKERAVTDAICNAAVDMTDTMAVKAIVTMTHSGYTAFKISSMRPKANIHAFTNNTTILTRLNLVWGVRAHYYDRDVSTDETIGDLKEYLVKNRYVKKGDLVVNLASMPVTEKGMGNMLKLSEA